MITLQQYLDENVDYKDWVTIILNKHLKVTDCLKEDLKKKEFNTKRYVDILRYCMIDEVEYPGYREHKIYILSTDAEKEIMEMEREWYYSHATYIWNIEKRKNRKKNMKEEEEYGCEM